MEENGVAAEGFSSNPRFKMLRRPWTLLSVVLVLISAGIFVYSQTVAFVWDEGFHLVAAQLIAWGKTPYIDFAFPQTLLNAYFNAGVLRVIGSSWRAVHAFDAIFVTATVWLVATYVMRHFPDQRGRLHCAIVAACLVGMNTVVVAFGPVAQAYGSGMLLAFAAFRVAIRSVDRATLWLALFTGLLAGAAAGSTLLTAPVAPVLLIWLFLQNRSGSRFGKALAFSVGAATPLLPELVLFLRAPRQTLFNVVQYQALFRRVNWGDVGAHDFDVFLDWTTSAETLLLGLLALAGVLFIAKKSDWERRVRNEFYLAAYVALALGVYISTAHPTFGRYFIFMIPFTAVIASVGFYYTACQLVGSAQVRWVTALVVFILAASVTKYVFDDRDGTHWSDYEAIAKKIKEVTPPGKEYMADEMVYFLLHQAPPSGMEFSYSHKIQLTPSEEKLYRIISFQELKEQIAKGRFSTVESCKDEVMDDFELDKHFANKKDFDDCSVYWRKSAAIR